MHAPEPEYSRGSWKSLKDPLKPPSPNAPQVTILGAYEQQLLGAIHRHVDIETGKLLVSKQKEYAENEAALDALLKTFESLCEQHAAATHIERPNKYHPEYSELSNDPSLDNAKDKVLVTYLHQRNEYLLTLLKNTQSVLEKAHFEVRPFRTMSDSLETTRKEIIQAQMAVEEQECRIAENEKRLKEADKPSKKLQATIEHDKNVLKRREKKVSGLAHRIQQIELQLAEQTEELSLTLNTLKSEIERHIGEYNENASPCYLTSQVVSKNINTLCRTARTDFGVEAQQKTIESICQQALLTSVRYTEAQMKRLPYMESPIKDLERALEMVISIEDITADIKQELIDLTRSHREQLGELISFRTGKGSSRKKIKALQEAKADYEIASRRLHDAAHDLSFSLDQRKVLLVHAMQFQFISYCCNSDAKLAQRSQKGKKAR